MNFCPKISIVTPSYNQGQYLEACINSVLNQGYPNLQYVIIDGGSADGSQEIIRRYEGKIDYWCSEQDYGQYDAINKGFSKTDGEIMAWLNSDDMYLPWTFSVVAEIFSALPEVEWITSHYPAKWDISGRLVKCSSGKGFTRKGFFRGEHLPIPRRACLGWIQQESTFWRRSLWERAGGKLDSKFRYAGDFDLWARFYQQGAQLVSVMTPLGGFRTHTRQKTAEGMDEYLIEAKKSLYGSGGRLASRSLAWFRCRLLQRLPGRGILLKSGLLEGYPGCEYDFPSNRWRLDLR